ncbi:Uncharacterised protein [uncultured archaeon]|nr:Uncharacterised protein [uncultured archaeon]
MSVRGCDFLIGSIRRTVLGDVIRSFSNTSPIIRAATATLARGLQSQALSPFKRLRTHPGISIPLFIFSVWFILSPYRAWSFKLLILSMLYLHIMDLGTSFSVRKGASSIVSLVFTLLDLFLNVQKALNKLLRSRRAPGYENINREEFCRVLDDIIGIIERSA